MGSTIIKTPHENRDGIQGPSAGRGKSTSQKSKAQLEGKKEGIVSGTSHREGEERNKRLLRTKEGKPRVFTLF